MLYDFSKANKKPGLMGPAPSSPSPMGPTPSGYASGSTAKAHGSTFNDNGKTLYYNAKNGSYLNESEWGRMNNPQPAAPKGLMSAAATPTTPSVPATPQGASDKMANDLLDSPFKGLAVNWQQVQGNRMNQMRADIGEQRAAQERAARVSANQRGLMAGGNSALAQGQQARIAENAAMMSQRGGLMIANDIDNQARDYDMRLAGAEAAWRQGVPAALAGAMMLPGNLQRQGIDNAAADYGLYSAKQMLPIQLGNAAAQGDATRANIAATGTNTEGQRLQNNITQEQASQIKDTLERLRRKEEQGIALTEMELQQKKWANDNSWWLAPLGLVAGALPGLGQAAGAMGFQPFAAK